MSERERGGGGREGAITICPQLVTELVSQSSGWLKDAVPPKVFDIVVTLLVSQTSCWLNAPAPENAYAMFVTLLVSQASSELKSASAR